MARVSGKNEIKPRKMWGHIFFSFSKLVKKMSNGFVNLHFSLYKPVSEGMFVYCSGSLSD